MNDQKQVLDVSWETILKATIIFFSFYIIYLIRDVLVLVVFALIISILFGPAIDFLRKFLPRVVAVVLVYLTAFGIIALSLYLVAPIFVSEIRQFSQFFPEYFEKISPPLRGLGLEAFENLESFTKSLEKGLTNISSNIFSAVGVIFGGLFSTIVIFAISLFLSLEEKGIEKAIGILSPRKYEAVVLSLWEKSQRKVAGWFGAILLGSLFVGLMTFFTCYVLNIKYAVSFGFLAGVSNIVPIIGPVVTGIVIATIVAMDSWLKALFFLIAFILIQQIENSILNPILIRKFIGLPPALVLISLLIGGKLWGLTGAILAIPISGIFYEFVRDFLKRKKEEKTVVL